MRVRITSTKANYYLDDRGYALPILGGISHQTVAGFLQTSSSGGSIFHGMADSILSIEFVDGTGTSRIVQKGTDEFNAAVVSMGLFGIVTFVTFKLGQRYYVQGIDTTEKPN